ncbi:MAG: alpha/beta hydrolase [Candidatus Eisenbacteria bacterium]|uniref:Alpha/beta hydrolase n=1 Tax=Eiseniibacteriota bacterium TaxID=2212470 RepID=A0A849SJX4_UNCEI|nr:alpha/beta hydrolase [Candidatus Eisenbacteria bacterium]
MNPSESKIPAIQIDVRIDRNTVLPGRAWCAESPRGLIAVVHGIGEHSGRYAALAERLVDRRFTVVALDLPGHGEATGPRGDIPSWSDLRDRIVPSMFTLTRGMPGQPPELPLVLLGHSMGGLLALDYTLTHSKTVLGAVSSAAAIRIPAPPSAKVMLARVAAMLSPTTGFPDGIAVEHLSRDSEVLDQRRADKRVHDRITPRTYFAMLDAQKRVLESARRLSAPVLLMHGAADKVTDPRGSLEFTAAAPHGIARLITYQDAPHEIFNDPARDQAIKDLIGWLDAIVVV